MLRETALSEKLRPSAQSVGMRGGAVVPLNYGSVAAELAICMRSVGLVDREDLHAVSLEADPASVEAALERRSAAVEPGQATAAGDGIWGRVSPARALFVAPVVAASALAVELRAELDATATIAEDPLVPIGVVGPATRGLLADLGVYRALAVVDGGAVASGHLAGSPATWLLLEDSWALALVDPAHATSGWDEMSSAGRRFGLGYVGAEAAERFELVRRRSADAVGC